MGLFETQPQLNSTSTAFSGSYALSNEIISQDTLQIFVWSLTAGIIIGIIFAIFKKITSWVWN